MQETRATVAHMTDEPCIHEPRGDEYCTDEFALVPQSKLGREAFVEGDRGSFTGTICHHVWNADETRLASDSDDHPMIRADHTWEEFSRHLVVG